MKLELNNMEKDEITGIGALFSSKWVESFIENFEKSSDFNDNMLMSYWFLSYYTTTYNDDFDMDSSNGNSDNSGGDFGGGGDSSAF